MIKLTFGFRFGPEKDKLLNNKPEKFKVAK